MKNNITIGIIGGTGSMGRWFEKFFCSLGHKVLISGRKTPLSYENLSKNSQIVILSTPIDAALKISEEIGPILNEEQLFMDFCSFKEKITESMVKNSKAEVVGTHPLFGPFTDSVKGQNIIICPGRGIKWLNWIETVFSSNGAIITRIDPVKHDRNMALVQGLTHILSISLGKTMQKMNILPEEIMLFATPVFRIKIDLMARLFAQDISLFADIIGKNKYLDDILNTFIISMDETRKNLVSHKDGYKDEHSKVGNEIKYLENIKDFLGNFCDAGLKESNEIISTIYNIKNDYNRK